MSLVVSYSVGNGDMFSIRHGSDNFTIIDCCISDDGKDSTLEELKKQREGKNISRFISTHPDNDHIMGLDKLDDDNSIVNFYCVKNNTTKEDDTPAFKRYCELRDNDKAFYIYKGCSRRWMNSSNDERNTSGIHILWPDTNNQNFRDALEDAEKGNSPNNISPIITYSIGENKFIWFGDLETDFMEAIEDEVDWPEIDVLFAPHHGRGSGKIPTSILKKLNPQVIIIGEAPAAHLNYYANYNTITQNSAGIILFECIDAKIHIYVGSGSYKVDFLDDYNGTLYGNYIGSIA